MSFDLSVFDDWGKTPVAPEPSPPDNVFRWGTVTSTSPLAVRLDGDTAPLASVPDTLVDGLHVGDRVWCQIYRRRVVIIGGAKPSTGSTPRILAARGLGTVTDFGSNVSKDFTTPVTFTLPSTRVIRFSGACRFTWDGSLTATLLVFINGIGSLQTLWRTTYRGIGTGDEWGAFVHAQVVSAGTYTVALHGQNYVGSQTVRFHQRSFIVEDMGDPAALGFV